MYKKKLGKTANQQGSRTVKIFPAQTVASLRLTAPVLVIAGWLSTMAPSMAVTTSYANDYRLCTAQLLNLGLTAQAVSQGCARALRPRDLSACVATINQQTQIPPVDALSSCRQSRRPQKLAKCVVGVSRNTEGAVNPSVLNYCGRSLLPVRFAECVVGLRSEIEIAPTQAMDTCIDASDRVTGLSPAAVPPTQVPRGGFNPSFEVIPMPGNPINQ
ncbi:hypothetical protein [Nostoc sp. CCY0012]|uniref:hypothetical protein n=1 Tax=Nostoc sp. CCY0012 TaxID=1056123 RepID=UPI0039C5B597